MEIGKVEAATGVSAGALRHYETLGLLDDRHVRRAPNGYRDFTDEGVERVALIAAGRRAGLSLRRIREGVDAWESGAMTEAERVATFRRHIADLDTRIAELTATRDYLLAKIS